MKYLNRLNNDGPKLNIEIILVLVAIILGLHIVIDNLLY